MCQVPRFAGDLIFLRGNIWYYRSRGVSGGRFCVTVLCIRGTVLCDSFGSGSRETLMNTGVTENRPLLHPGGFYDRKT